MERQKISAKNRRYEEEAKRIFRTKKYSNIYNTYMMESIADVYDRGKNQLTLKVS